MSNDIRRLKDEADISRVVDYCGIRRGRRIGSAQFVICPNPEHEDEHPTNAYYRDGWNTVYCTTCNKNMGAIDILMWQLGKTYGEAADILWELEGEPDWYYDKPGRTHGKKFTISISELGLLGIRVPGTICIPVRFTKYREYKNLPYEYQYMFMGDGYLLVKKVSSDWKDFLSEGEMKELVLEKAQQKLQEYDRIEQRFCSDGLFRENREKIADLMKRAGEGAAM